MMDSLVTFTQNPYNYYLISKQVSLMFVMFPMIYDVLSLISNKSNTHTLKNCATSFFIIGQQNIFFLDPDTYW